MSDPIRIATISGSLRRASHNTRLARFVASRLASDTVEIDEISLLDLDIPMFNEDLEAEQGHPQSVLELKRRLIAAHGLLFATPEYNGSLSPALKNAIDWASRPREGEPVLACFRGKAAGILAASPGRLGGLRGMRHLRTILSGIGVHVIPTEFALASAHDAFDAQGALSDANAAKGAIGVGDSLVRTARALRHA